MRRLSYKNSFEVKYLGKPSLHTIAQGSSNGYKKEEEQLEASIKTALGIK